MSTTFIGEKELKKDTTQTVLLLGFLGQVYVNALYLCNWFRRSSFARAVNRYPAGGCKIVSLRREEQATLCLKGTSVTAESRDVPGARSFKHIRKILLFLDRSLLLR